MGWNGPEEWWWKPSYNRCLVIRLPSSSHYGTDNEIIYHCGASSKDAGKKITTISKIEEKELYKTLIDEMLKNEDLDI